MVRFLVLFHHEFWEFENLSFSFYLVIQLCQAETAKLIPGHLVTYKVFGEPHGPHYAHYDMVGGQMVCIASWLLGFFP